MLQQRDLPTLAAALRFWQEEIGPHGPEAALPYLEAGDGEPLAANELTTLRHELQSSAVRYVLIERTQTHLTLRQLFATEEAALRLAERTDMVAAALLPAPAG